MLLRADLGQIVGERIGDEEARATVTTAAVDDRAQMKTWMWIGLWKKVR